MKYFNSLPTVSVTTKGNKTQSYKNLMTRLSMIPSVLTNPINYYTYDIQEGDTPEIVAQKYYGDSYRYWIVMFCNEIMDTQWDWPLSSSNFNNYIDSKYSGTGIDVYGDVKAYKKTITQTDVATNIVTTNSVEISEDEYNSMTNYTKNLNTLTGTVIVNVQKSVQTYYDYEVQKNEAKRTIRLLNKNYVTQIEQEFKDLLK